MHAAQLLFPLVHLLTGASLPPQSQDEILGAKSQLGKELMAAGRYTDAAQVYGELVKALPDNPGLLVNLGMALHLAGRDREAVPRLEAAFRLQPSSLPAALFLGASNLRLGRPAAAVDPLQKAVRLQPENREARSLLVEAFLGLERYAEAEPHLRRLTEQAPTDPGAWFSLGKTYEELARDAFGTLLARDPESPFGLALAAEARLKAGQRNAAFHLYRQALERDANLRGLRAAIAAIYRSAGHLEWAAVEEERERGLARPDCPRESLECSFAAGRHRDVIAAASKSKALEANYWLARSYNELAAEAFARLTALPPSARSHELSAESYRDGRRYAESAEEWRKAVALEPGEPRLMIELAVTLRLGRDFPAAQQVIEELLRAEPDAPEPNYLLGDVLLAQQHPERAIAFLEKAVRAPPARPHAHGALGRAYALVGRAAEAIPHLKQALPADTDGSLRYQLARSYQAAGQTELARAALEDYEEFRKASQPASEADGQEGVLKPPDGIVR